MANQPQMNVKILGEENTTLMNRTISWTPSSKVEATYVISSLDGSKDIAYDTVSSIKTIVFYGSGNYTVSVTTGVSATEQTINFESSDFFIFSPTAAFASTITGLSISTTSSNAVTVEARVYGQQ